MEFTILMPCLNEAETLSACIRKASSSILALNLDAEILIADNGSTDSSILIAEELGARVIHVVEKGYGNTLRSGILHANAKYIIMGDSDDSYDFSDLEYFVNKLRKGDDLVMGNRFLGGIEKNAMPMLHRYLGNPVLSFIGKVLYKVDINDFHCGLRGFNRKSILDLKLSTSGMEFASEMIVKSAMQNLLISEVPTKLYRDGRSRKPHLNTWRDGWRHLYFLLIHSPKWLFLYPGIVFIVMGVMAILTSIVGDIYISQINLQSNYIYYCSIFSIVGFQSVSFYFFSIVRKHNSEVKGLILSIFNNVIGNSSSYVISGLIIFILGTSAVLATNYNIDTPSINKDANHVHFLNVLIPAVMFSILGVQIIFNSFFLGLLSNDQKIVDHSIDDSNLYNL